MKTTTPKITIGSIDFERSHGRKPRGTGSWAFEITFYGGEPDSVHGHETTGPIFAQPGGITYGQAKKWIREDAKRRAAQYREDGIEITEIIIDALG